MLRSLLSATFAFALFAAPAVSFAQHDHHEGETAEEHAAHADEHGHDDHHGGGVTIGAIAAHKPLWAAIGAFLILLALIGKFGIPAINRSLSESRESIKAQIEEAQRIKAEAEAKAAEYEARLADMDTELENIRKELEASAEKERDRIVAEAEATAARMRKDAEFQIQQRIKQLRDDVTREAVEAAVTAAEEMLTTQTQAADQTRLAEDYLQSVGEAARQEKRA